MLKGRLDIDLVSQPYKATAPEVLKIAHGKISFRCTPRDIPKDLVFRFLPPTTRLQFQVMDLHDFTPDQRLASRNPYCVVSWHGKEIGRTPVTRQSMVTMDGKQDRHCQRCRSQQSCRRWMSYTFFEAFMIGCTGIPTTSKIDDKNSGPQSSV